MASAPPPPVPADDLPDALPDEPVDDADTVSGSSAGGAPTRVPAWPDDDDQREEGWEEEWVVDPPARTASDIDWSGLEVESFDALPAGRLLAGRAESFRVDGLGAEEVAAVLDTGSARSHLHASLAPGAGGGVDATFAGRTVALTPRREGDFAVVDVTVHIGNHKQAVALVLDRAAADEAPRARPIVLGVDALAGLVVVDPAAADLLSRR